MSSILSSAPGALDHDDPDDQDRPADTEQRGTTRDGDGRKRRYTVVNWRPGGQSGGRDWYPFVLTIAFILLISVASATMYVSYAAQAAYIAEHKTDQLAVHLEAISWDLAALVFAVLALATAMRGHSALRARLGNLACVAASIAMNAAPAWDGADTELNALLVWVGPPLLYAATSDTLILEIQQRAVARRGLPEEPASMWALLAVAVRAVGGMLAWLLRCVLAPIQTPMMFRRWYIEEVPFAPGRTVAGDRAAEAERQALEAGTLAERVREQSAEAIAAAEQRAAERLDAERERHAADLQAAQEAAEQRLAEQREAHTAALEELRQRLAEVDRRAGEGLAAAEQRREADLQAQAEAYTREIAELRMRVEQAVSEAERERAEVRRLQGELEIARGAMSLRARVELAYAQLGRAGDPRHGRYDAIDQVAEELQPKLGDVEGKTVRRYLRDAIGNLAATGQDVSDFAAETRVARVNGSMIGGA